jgi:OmpA family protein/PEGA domain-containing protein
MRRNHPALILVAFLFALLIVSAPAIAQSSPPMGKLHITVIPKQAYVFLDGKAIRDGSQTIDLPEGEHTVDVSNYGYSPKTQQAQIVAGKTLSLDVELQKSGEKVSGPFGDIEFKGHPRAAVLLNGTSPEYFVGHVDEFDNNFLWHQWLLVQPGNYAVTVTREGQTIWSGPVNVKAGQRIVVNLNHDGKTTTKDFKRGLTLGPQPRFEAGTASAMVPIAPVTAQLSASQSTTNCGQSATLNWNASNAVDTSITNLGTVVSNGDQSVSPTQNTTYQLVAKGPGGVVTRTATIDVEAQPQASLTLSTPEVTYHKIGDTVVQHQSAILSWRTSDGNRVTLQPLGNVKANGSETVYPAPNQANPGPVDQDVTYSLYVTNACGGTATRTATLHVVGSIDPAPSVTLASVFYPTNYPERSHPKLGLLPSQRNELSKAASTFENHEKYSQPNQLVVVGHADVRGSVKYNMTLSQRRAELVKNYLISQGIPANKIEVRADGKGQELSQQQVQKLQAQDPQSPPAWMTKRQKATWLAYNRRVDIIREPVGQDSTEAFPNDARGARILWQRPQPSLKALETIAAQAAVPSKQTLASNLARQ